MGTSIVHQCKHISRIIRWWGSSPGLFQLQMRISFPFLLAKYLRRFLLVIRTCSFFALLYVEGTYARLVYTCYKNIFHMIAVLVVFLASN